MAEPTRPPAHHISSAVVTAFPARIAEVVGALGALPDTEVHQVDGGKIVIVLEGPDTDTIGGRLTAIALMDGVISANLVFEHIEFPDEAGDAS